MAWRALGADLLQLRVLGHRLVQLADGICPERIEVSGILCAWADLLGLVCDAPVERALPGRLWQRERLRVRIDGEAHEAGSILRSGNRERVALRKIHALLRQDLLAEVVELRLESLHPVFSTGHSDVRALLDAGALDHELDELAHAATPRVVVDGDFGRDLHLPVRGVEELGANNWIGEPRGAGREELDRTPYPRVAVAYAVREREVPADGHQHRHVLADQPVPAVAPFA